MSLPLSLRARRAAGALFAVLGLSAFAAPMAAQLVEHVVDGDTIIVEGVGSVRLIGVDTPETVHPDRPVEVFGREATAYTKGLVEGRTVRLEYDQERTDRYGRTLAYVYLEDGTFANAEIIRQGYGHAYTAFPFRHMERFRELEREARQDRRGLWAVAVGGSGRGVDETESSATATNRPERTVSEPPPGVPGTVFVTRTGTKYHIDGCRFLSKSKIPMKLEEAEESHDLCGACARRLEEGQ